MEFPGVTIEHGDSVEAAADKVAFMCRALGEDLYSLEPLNSLLPTSAYCHFFQTRLEGRDCVVVVMIKDWDEGSLIRILNVLLEIRMETGSAGSPPLFRFCSVQPVPPVMRTLFGDSLVAEFECRAAPVVRFGGELEVEMAMQVAAVGMFLLREILGLETDFWDDQGEERVMSALRDHLAADGFPEEGAPLNTLVALGFLYGERQRATLPHSSSWVELEELGPWPGVVFEETRRRGESKHAVKRVAFSPISLVIGAFQKGTPSVLSDGVKELRAKCAAEFGASNAGQPSIRQKKDK